MNILFMSLSNYNSIYFHGLYSDLLRQFIDHGDEVFLIAPFERSSKDKERIVREKGATLVKIQIWNMQRTNIVEKAVSMLTIDKIFIRAIREYFSDIKFDLVLYPTPPITLLKAVEFVKRRDNAITYLLLKDIFPQNAIDIGLMSKTGLKGLSYRFFRRQEKKLYKISDHIGCMSKANVEYVISHNPEISPDKIEVCPNTTDPIDMSCTLKDAEKIRKKYEIPLNKTVFVYGGNLGKPQGIPFIIDCLKSCEKINEAYFLIVGSGTEYDKLKNYIDNCSPQNVKLIERLPKEDYDHMIGSCDVGLIFLDYRFSIPNFPSRILAYMQAKLPVLASTDVITDIGKVIEEKSFGWWCESNSTDEFKQCINQILEKDKKELKLFGENAYNALQTTYSSSVAYKTIINSL